MSKNKILIVLLMMLSIGIVSLYTTYAYEETNNMIIKESTSDHNLNFSLKISTDKEIIINPNEEKFVDISIKNTFYEENVGYGTYYSMIRPEKIPDNVTIELAEHSTDTPDGIIKKGETKIISIKITNKSEYVVNLIVGILGGFENGSIEDLPEWDNDIHKKIK